MAYNTDKKFIDDMLAMHNKCREIHNAPALRHSAILDRSAQEWANKLLKADSLSNSPLAQEGKIGENITCKKSADSMAYSGSDITKTWYGDISNYDFKTGGGDAGNFTQIVWKATKEVGFGKAQKQGKCVFVAHYRPPGNVDGKFVRNVGPAKAGAKLPLPPKPAASKDGKGARTSVTKDTMEYEGGGVKDEGKLVAHSDNTKDAENVDAVATQMEKVEVVPLTKKQIFINSVIDEHNKHREKHGVPLLKENKMLNQMAQTWADILLEKAQLEHSDYQYEGEELGESLAARYSNQPCEYKPDEVIDKWYGEEAKFPYDTEPEDIQAFGNFSQIIWRNTKEVGVGTAHSNEGEEKKAVFVCLYYPAGNVLQEFTKNVPKAK